LSEGRGKGFSAKDIALIAAPFLSPCRLRTTRIRNAKRRKREACALSPRTAWGPRRGEKVGGRGTCRSGESGVPFLTSCQKNLAYTEKIRRPRGVRKPLKTRNHQEGEGKEPRN